MEENEEFWNLASQAITNQTLPRLQERSCCPELNEIITEDSLLQHMNITTMYSLINLIK
jgi:hypothetical protein